MKKKLVSLLLVAAMGVTMLAGCGGSDDSSTGGNAQNSDSQQSGGESSGDVSLTVWASQDDQEWLQLVIDNFKAENPDAADWNIQKKVTSSADAKDAVLKDAEAAADIFEFASDQLASLQSAGVLYRVTRDREEVEANNEENAVAAALVDGELYGYPSTSNSYFMYYDKSKYTEEDVKSLETMLAKDLGDVKNFSIDVDNGWYMASLFFGAGCTLFGEDGYDATQCDFNNAQGLLAGKYWLGLCTNSKVANQDDNQMEDGFKNGTIAACVTGTWKSTVFQELLGENFGVTVMPSMTLEDGTVMNPSTIVNYNIFGINAQTKYPVEAMTFANYLTGEASQKLRFEMRSSTPTNKNLVSDTELLGSNPAVQVLTEQVKTSTVQASIPQMANFWSPMESLAKDFIAGKYTEDDMQTALDKLVESILTKLGD